MKISACIHAVIFSAILTACGGGSRTTAMRRPYAPPAAPAAISDEAARTRYVAEHYWDLFDFADTALWSDRKYIMESFAPYFQGLATLGSEYAVPALQRLLHLAAADSAAGANVREICDLCLDDPNSPMRNEELYIILLRELLADPSLSPAEKIAPGHRLRMLLRNRPGEVAADFAYIDTEGRRGTLHTTAAPGLLLFFHNPGCAACAELIQHLEQSEAISEAITSGRLKVLALYPDSDTCAWAACRDELPDGWINARDPDMSITRDTLYDLRAIPTLYLLDSRKRVVVKDAADTAPIERSLAQTTNNTTQ